MEVVPVQTLAYPGGLHGGPVPSMQNLDRVPEAFPARSSSRAIPIQHIFPLGDLVEEKSFSVALEEETLKSSSGCAVSLTLPKLIIIWQNPSWTGDDGEDSAKKEP